jgi:hypothetical protein
MIPCQVCGNQNPIGTRFCRACGERIAVVKVDQLAAAVRDDQVSAASLRRLEGGRSLLLVGLFLLVCALVLRYAVVPPLPAADVPPLPAGELLPP